jgi:hypothetical protein
MWPKARVFAHQKKARVFIYEEFILSEVSL